MVEDVRDHILIEVIFKIPFKPGSNIFIDRLQLEEDNRQTVHKTNEIGPAIIVRSAEAGKL